MTYSGIRGTGFKQLMESRAFIRARSRLIGRIDAIDIPSCCVEYDGLVTEKYIFDGIEIDGKLLSIKQCLLLCGWAYY